MANTVSPSCGVCTGRIDAREPVLRHHRQALARTPCRAGRWSRRRRWWCWRADRCARHRPDHGVRSAARRATPSSARPCAGGGRPPNSALLLQRPRPELRHVAHGRVAARIHRHQRADLQAGGRIDGRGAAQPALEIAGLGAQPRAGIAEGEVGAGLAGRRIAELAIRRPVPRPCRRRSAGRTGWPWARSARRRRRSATPRPRSLSQRITPSAAERPNAEPPDEADGIDALVAGTRDRADRSRACPARRRARRPTPSTGSRTARR